MYREKDIEDPAWKAYEKAIKTSFCPYLKKSSEFGLTTYSNYDVSGTRHWEELSFALALIHTEMLRKERSKESGSRKILLCENLLFKIKQENIVRREMFFQWTHWALKTIYTDKALLFGKFWPEERKSSIHGKLIPDPPVCMLSIRSTVGRSDARFFEITPKLIDVHTAAKDDNKSVFGTSALRSLDSMLDSALPQCKDKNDVVALGHEIAATKPLKAIIHEFGFEFV